MKPLVIFLTLISTGLSGQNILWQEYVEAKDTGGIADIRDYSYAGYHRGEDGIPQVNPSTHTYFNVIDYGAVPNDCLSDRQAILDAIAAAEMNTPAVVFFPEGRFRLNEKGDEMLDPIAIRKNNMVIKGSGMGKTELYAARPHLHYGGAFIHFVSNRPSDYYWRGGEVVANFTSYPEQVEGFKITVNNTSKLSPDMYVNIDADLNVNTPRGANYYLPHAVPNGALQWHGGDNDYLFEMHQIKAIYGDTVEFYEPIHLPLEFMEDAKLWSVEHMLEECGIEDLTLAGNFKDLFRHHYGSTISETYRMLRFDYVANSWANNIRFKEFTTGFWLNKAMFTTGANISFEGNTGHALVYVEESYGTLFAYCNENENVHHGLGGGSSATGSVYLRCRQFRNLEAHGAYMRVSLYDLNEGSFRMRGGGRAQFPHHSEGLNFWNWKGTETGNIDFWPLGQNYGYMMPPVIAGMHGDLYQFADVSTDLKRLESQGTKISNPVSLFEAQIEHRLNTLPEWYVYQAEAYESVSRDFWAGVKSPSDHSAVATGQVISVELDYRPGLKTTEIIKTELLESTTSRLSGYQVKALKNDWTDKFNVSFTQQGTHLLRFRLTNSRGEVTESSPIQIFVGDYGTLQAHTPIDYTMMTQDKKEELLRNYRDNFGGGEGRFYQITPAYSNYDALELNSVANQYLADLANMQATFAQNYVAPVHQDPANIAKASTLTDNNFSAYADNIYGYQGSHVQFDLGTEQYIDAVEFHWLDIRDRKVRLSIETSSDNLCWNSLVNDEQHWEASVTRVGNTLERLSMPSGNPSVVYMPKRKARYVRLHLISFPNNQLSEIRILGEVPPAPLSGNDLRSGLEVCLGDFNSDSQCPQIFHVSDLVTKGTYQADDIISSNGQVNVSSGGQVIFNAGSKPNEYIELTSGFNADGRVDFSVENLECYPAD